MTNGYTVRYFDLLASVYKPQFFLQEKLAVENGEIVLTDTGGAEDPLLRLPP